MLVAAACAPPVARRSSQHPGVPPAPRHPKTATFAALGERIHPGDRLRISVGGQVLTGKLSRVSSFELVIRRGHEESAFACESVERIETDRDSVASGAIIGGILAAVPAWNACNNKKRDLPCVAVGIGAYAAIGALLDRAHSPVRLVYVASTGSCDLGK